VSEGVFEMCSAPVEIEREALDRAVWRNGFEGGYGPVVRQTTERMDE
jgi:hypothetical protein